VKNGGIRHLLFFAVAVAAEDGETRVLRIVGIGTRKFAKDEDGAASRLELPGVETIGAEAG